MNLNPECKTNYIERNSQIQEAMADWFGTTVTSNYLKEHPRTADSPEERIKPIASLATIFCKAGVALYNNTTDNSHYIYRMSMDTHPSEVSRIENIALRDSELQKYLGCTPVKKFQCKYE